ncbi:MAG: DEAD/DEAH box helicase [Paenibacillus sp.]|nr:DEAD/DEAH box helicase [Paenibacillus sp.]
MRFDELELSDDVLDALDAMRFGDCTPIQEKAIPLIFQRRDLIAVAQTGTGKTAAYLLPVIDMLADEPEPTDTVSCIVMSPTRELAQQIDRQLEGFSYYLPISSVAIYGGTDGKEFARQQNGLKRGADVVIATPGRLIAHLQLGGIDLSKVQYFILDEADRMLDMGFFDDIMQIVKHLPKERQTLMFSATMPPKIQQLAKAILNDPAEIKIAVSRPTEKIAQSACVVYENQKTRVLKHLFRTVSDKRVIVFAASKLKVKDLAKSLRNSGWKVGEMHSDLEQERRDEVMHDFRATRLDILVATDILARGIDIDDISLVVNYDVPREAEDYVHRIGRTARAGAGGSAVTLISEEDMGRFGDLEKFLGYEVKKLDLPEEIGETPVYDPKRRSRGRGGKPKSPRTKGRSNGGQRSKDNKQAENQRDNSRQRPSRKPSADHHNGEKKAQAHKPRQSAKAGDNNEKNTAVTTENNTSGDTKKRKRNYRPGKRPANRKQGNPASKEQSSSQQATSHVSNTSSSTSPTVNS